MSGKVIPFARRIARAQRASSDSFDVERIVRKLTSASDEARRVTKSEKVAEAIAKRNAALEPPRRLRRDKPEIV